MKIIFCQSFLSIPKTLSVTETCKSKFLVTTSNKQIYRFFSDLYDKQTVQYIDNTKAFFSFNPFVLISNLVYNLKLKKKIKNNFSNITGNEIIFSLVAFAPEIAFAVKILSKKNNIFYYTPTKLPDDFKKAKGINAWIKKKLLLKFYGLQTNAVNNKKIIILKYSKEYYKSVNAKKIKIMTNESIIQKIADQKLNIPSNKILFFTGGLPELGIIDNKEYIEKTNTFINLLSPENLILKLHPRFNKKYSAEHKLKEIESYIPAYIMLYKTNIVISFQSSVLYEAANIDKTAISLLKIYEFVSNEYRTNYINYLNNNLKPGKKILFPKTFEELSKILKIYEFKKT